MSGWVRSEHNWDYTQAEIEGAIAAIGWMVRSDELLANPRIIRGILSTKKVRTDKITASRHLPMLLANPQLDLCLLFYPELVKWLTDAGCYYDPEQQKWVDGVKV